MTFSITIIDMIEVKEKQRQDIAAYHRMLSDIVDEITKQGLIARLVQPRESSLTHKIEIESLEPVVIQPLSLKESEKLSYITFEVPNQEIAESIKTVAEGYKDKYSYLEHILINSH